jgi:maleylacetoacetate isomerase/maleylpyruvate isomerase
MALTLYSAWRATAPYRVRIGLALKGVEYDYFPVDLLAGDQHKAAYRAVNPQRLTPALDLGDGVVLTQSLAILEWLEETRPEPAFLPRDPLDRARVRAMAYVIACDIHPLNNPRVTRALEAMDVAPPRRAKWIERWIVDGFNTLEPVIARHGQGWAFGDQPGLADICLIPQVYSARRFEVDLEPYPAIRAVADRAAEHPAFAAAHPDRQPDAKKA